MKNKIIALCLICGLGVMQSTVMAAAATSSFLQGYDTEEGQLRFYMAAQDYTVAADNLEVTLGGEEVPVALIETTASVPVTYYCLTDVSGSMRDEQFAQAKEALQAICDGMSEGDNMVLATLGNNVETTGFLNDREAASEAIRALAVGNEDTNLYSGIVESIHLLEENTAVCQRKCLVILSDGKDDQKTGITKSEADNAIVDSRIPVYTVATLRSEQTEEQLADAKLLGSFANESAGGIHYAPVLMEGESGSTAGTNIVASMKQGMKVTTDISEYQASRDLVLLRVIYQDIGNVSIEDTMEVYAQDLKYALPETNPAEQETNSKEQESDPAEQETNPKEQESNSSEQESNPAEQETETMVPETESGSEPGSIGNRWLVPGGIAAALLVIAAVLAGKKRKKQREEKRRAKPAQNQTDYRDSTEYGVSEETAEAAEQNNPVTGEMAETAARYEQSTGKTVETEETKPNETMETALQGKVYDVTFTVIGHEKRSVVLRMEEDAVVTVGRTINAQLILNPNDSKLSGVHCKMRCQRDRIEVWDAGSKNGTFLNGVPVERGISGYVENQGKIRAGSYEYRISIAEAAE